MSATSKPKRMPRKLKASPKTHNKSASQSIAEQSPAKQLLPEWPPLSPLAPTDSLSLETLLHDQIYIIRNLFTANLCKRYVSFLSTLPLLPTPSRPKEGEAVRVNDRIQFHDPSFAQSLWTSTALHALIRNSAPDSRDGALPLSLDSASAPQSWGGGICGLNPNIRIYRYRSYRLLHHYLSLKLSVRLIMWQERGNTLVHTVCILIYFQTSVTRYKFSNVLDYSSGISRSRAMSHFSLPPSW